MAAAACSPDSPPRFGRSSLSIAARELPGFHSYDHTVPRSLELFLGGSLAQHGTNETRRWACVYSTTARRGNAARTSNSSFTAVVSSARVPAAGDQGS